MGSTGRMPYGRQSSRSKRIGPAATGAAVASRRAVTASANSPGASGASSWEAGKDARELEHAHPLRLVTEAARQQAASLRPVRGELADGGHTHDDVAAEVDGDGSRQADERRRGPVLVPLAEQRVLDLPVHAVEDAVVPVEAAAGIGNSAEQRKQDRAVERPLLVGLRAVRARGRRCAAAGSRSSSSMAAVRVFEPEQPVGAGVDIRCAPAAGSS